MCFGGDENQLFSGIQECLTSVLHNLQAEVVRREQNGTMNASQSTRSIAKFLSLFHRYIAACFLEAIFKDNMCL